jgi:hypothetical protein
VLSKPDLVTATGRGQVHGFGAQTDSCTTLLGNRQIVVVQGVLRADVAPDVALSHELTAPLRHAESVPLARAGVVEGDREIRVKEAVALAKRVGGHCHEPCLRRQLTRPRIRRHRPDVEHVRGKVVVRVEHLARVRLRPRVIEHIRGRPHRHVGVHQGATAVAGRLHRQDVVEWLDVVQAVLTHPQPPVVGRDRSLGKLPAGQRRPRSTTATSTPACASRHAATAPPNPLPITNASKESRSRYSSRVRC